MASQNSKNSFHTAQGPASGSQNLNGVELPAELIIIPNIADVASKPNMIQSMYTIVKVAGKGICQEYKENNITVMGGAAYCIYARHDQSLPKMDTNDIDMVWWTQKRVENNVITGFIETFRERIQLTGSIDMVQQNLRKILGLPPTDRIELQVSEADNWAPTGIIINSNIHISIIINGTHIIKNLCEISIHNGISSQMVNMNHTNLRRKNATDPSRSALADPIYCDDREEFTIELYNTRIPTIARYILQQLFAYKNLRIQATGESIPKSHIRLYRVLHFCLTGNSGIITYIDEHLAQCVRSFMRYSSDIKQLKMEYIAEVRRDITTLMSFKPPILLSITNTALEHAHDELQRKGGSRRKRTVKRKKNKSKIKKRSTR